MRWYMIWVYCVICLKWYICVIYDGGIYVMRWCVYHGLIFVLWDWYGYVFVMIWTDMFMYLWWYGLTWLCNEDDLYRVSVYVYVFVMICLLWWCVCVSVMDVRCDVGCPMLSYPGVVDDGIFDTTTPPPSGRVRRTRTLTKMVNIQSRQDEQHVVHRVVVNQECVVCSMSTAGPAPACV